MKTLDHRCTRAVWIQARFTAALGRADPMEVPDRQTAAGLLYTWEGPGVLEAL